MRIHLPLLLSALPLVACGGEDDGPIKPEGPHYTYVVSEANVPTNNREATEFGLDLNGDDTVDNRLGEVLAALGAQGFDVQQAITDAIDQGDIILLADLQTTDFSNASGAGLQIKLGDSATAMPAPCTDAADVACRKHLAGTGSFTIAAGSPTNAAVTGRVRSGAFDGGPGNISLKIAIGSPEGVQLDLIGARARALGMSETGIEELFLAGALTEKDLNEQVIPAIHQQLLPIIADDCDPAGAPPDCGCANPSTGRTILMLLDTSPKDCAVTPEEISGNPLLMSLLAPDVEIDGKPALSLGLKVSTVKASF